MFVRRVVAGLVLTAVLAGCGAVPSQSTAPSPSAAPSPTAVASVTPAVPTDSLQPTLPPRPTPPPTRQPPPTPVPTPAPTGDIVVTLLPQEYTPEARPAIPGERICFLVVVDDRNPGDGEITFSAVGDGVMVDSVPAAVAPNGQPAELWVTVEPYAGFDPGIATLTLTVTHGGAEPVDWVETRSIIVYPDQDSRAAIAQQYFDFWVDYLARERPELGIDATTEWDSTFVSMLLIVSKYAYWSDEWEMVVAWHEMVPPDDFTEVYLRRRSSETGYSVALRQDSYANGTEPHEIAPPALIR